METEIDDVDFDPPELRQQLIDAIKALQDILVWEPDSVNPESGKISILQYMATKVRNKTVLKCSLKTDDDNRTRPTVRELLSWAEILNNFQLEDRMILRMDGTTLIYIDGSGEEEETFLAQISYRGSKDVQKVAIDGKYYSIKIVTGFTPFALFIEREGLNTAKGSQTFGDFEKTWHYFPSHEWHTGYLEISHPEDAQIETIEEVAQSFLFELATAANLNFTMMPYPTSKEIVGEIEETPDGKGHALKLRPLVIGKGMRDVHDLFVAGCSASPAEYALIHFVKVIEFVSATVIRIAGHEALRVRLSRSQALSPDAQFLDDLVALIEQNRIYKKDAEALSLTLRTVCDPLAFREIAPSCVKPIRQLKGGDDVEARQNALDRLSKCLSSTRNELVHAKANYKKSGDECPENELEALTACAKLAAEFAIRWFGRQREEQRVVTV